VPDRELKVNSLSRYSKESPLFILEEHGHCEVPAGCGGVVLRWRDPRVGVPVSLWLHSTGTARIYLDGSPPPSGRPVVPFGEHVLAFVLTDVDPAYAALRFAALYGHLPTHLVANSVAVVRSAPDGTWRYTSVEPDDDGWMHPGFDDSGWSSMVERDDEPVDEDQRRDAYRRKRLIEFGALPLGIDAGGGTTWVRKAFTTHPPGTTE
jgi:hypothetical protein